MDHINGLSTSAPDFEENALTGQLSSYFPSCTEISRLGVFNMFFLGKEK